MAKTISIINQKGGVGKTTTAFNLGVALTREGHKVLLVDWDYQASLTKLCGYRRPEELPSNVCDVIRKTLSGEKVEKNEAIIRHPEKIDLLPSHRELTTLDYTLSGMSGNDGRLVLKEYLKDIKQDYDFVLIDNGPNLNFLELNSLAAADSLIIPVIPEDISATGLEDLLQSFVGAKMSFNPELNVEGILFTMVIRNNNARDTMADINAAYGKDLKIFETKIPRAAKAANTKYPGRSIFRRNPSGNVALGYSNLAKEVLGIDRDRQRPKIQKCR